MEYWGVGTGIGIGNVSRYPPIMAHHYGDRHERKIATIQCSNAMFIQTYKSFTLCCCFASSNRLQRLKVPRAESFETPKGLLKSADHIYLPLFFTGFAVAVADSKQHVHQWVSELKPQVCASILGAIKLGEKNR